jgi:hypothetical protein
VVMTVRLLTNAARSLAGVNGSALDPSFRQ